MYAKGKIKVISTSKIRKITAIKKNRKEKGIRDEFLGSNPHSQGEFFSKSIAVFLEIKEANSIIKELIIKVKKAIKESNKIDFYLTRSKITITDLKDLHFYQPSSELFSRRNNSI